MRKINIYNRLLIFTIAATFLGSCKKDLLDKQPLDQISTETFYKTADDVQQALTGVYSTLKYGFNGYNKVYLDCLTDNAFCQFDQGYNDVKQMAYGPYSPLYGIVEAYWQANYQGIAASNLFIQNVASVNMDATAKKQAIAEVRLLRARYYFNLVNRYGDVLLYKVPATLTNANVARSPKAEVLAFIKEDLDFAVANLPDVAYNGHVVKGTALGLEAKYYLFNQDYTNAAALSDQVISGGKFSLYADYRGLFYKKYQENNPEIMFSTKYQAPNDEQGYYNGIDIEIGFYAAIDPYQEMVDSYETTAGKPIADPASGYNAANKYANRDPRLHASIKGSDQTWYKPDGSVFTNSDPSPTKYQQVKYIDSTLFPIAYGDLNKEDVGIIHLRYADVLLTYAEAKNELSGPDPSVYAALNKVRARVNMPAVNQTIYGNQSALRNFIRHERRIELAFEGQRYDDIIRWKIADQVLPAIKNPPGVTVKFAQNNYLWPIPQHELPINSQLTQNPGY